MADFSTMSDEELKKLAGESFPEEKPIEQMSDSELEQYILKNEERAQFRSENPKTSKALGGFAGPLANIAGAAKAAGSEFLKSAVPFGEGAAAYFGSSTPEERSSLLNQMAEDTNENWKRHPWASGLGTGTGMMTGGAITPTLKIAPKAYTQATKLGRAANFLRNRAINATNIAGDAGLAAAEASVSERDPYKAGLMGAGSKAVGEALTMGAPAIDKFAQERAVKAATGTNRKGIRDLTETDALDLEGGGSDLGKFLLADDRPPLLSKQGMLDYVTPTKQIEESGRAGGPIVGWFDSASNISDKAGKKKEVFGRQIGEIGKTVDEIMPRAVEGGRIGRNIASEARSFAPTGANVRSVEPMIDEAVRYKNMSPMSFAQAQKLKNAHIYKPSPAGEGYAGNISPAKRENIYKRSVGKEMDRVVGEAIENTGPSLKDDIAKMQKYPEAKANYGKASESQRLAHENATGDFSSRGIKPTTGMLFAGESASGNRNLGIIAGAANEIITQRGNSFLARSANALAKGIQNPNIIERFPMFQKWSDALSKAGMSGGRAFAITHIMLMNQDPAYMEFIKASEEAP